MDRNAARIPKVQSGRNFFMNIILISEVLFNMFELCHTFSKDLLHFLNLWFVPHSVDEVGICDYSPQHLSLG